MPNITTIDQFKTYILHMLGFPVVNVELSDTQISYIISDSIEEFCRISSEEGGSVEHVTLVVSANVGFYCLSGYNIESVLDYNVYNFYDVNTLFSPAHVLLYDQLIQRGGILGGFGGSLPLSEWSTALGYLKTVSFLFDKGYRAKWHKFREILEIIPVPKQTTIAAVTFYVREREVDLYNHPLVKRLVVARCKYLWASHLRKYNMTLPDGIQISDFVAEAKEEIEKVREDIRLESPLSTDIIIG